MPIADDNLIIKTFMGAKIENPPYPDSIVALNGQYHESDKWLDTVIEKIDAIDGVTLLYHYNKTIFNIVKYHLVDGKETRQIDAWGTDKYKVVLEFINKYNAL